MYICIIIINNSCDFQFAEVTGEASALRDQLEQLKVGDHHQYLLSFYVCMWIYVCIYMYMCVLSNALFTVYAMDAGSDATVF